MPLIVKKNSLLGETIEPPIKSDGSTYAYWCVDARNPTERIYADSLDEIDSHLCGTSGEANEEDKWRDRAIASFDLVIPVREMIHRQMIDEGIVLDGWELDVYNEVGKTVDLVYGWGDGSDPIRDSSMPIEKMHTRDIWKSRVPLVLFDFNYHPTTEIAEPMSAFGDYLYTDNLFVFRVWDSLSFIKSLANMGILNYGLTLVDEW